MSRANKRLSLAFLAVALAGAFTGAAVTTQLDLPTRANAAQPAPQQPAPAAQLPAARAPDGGVSFVNLAKLAGPAVVNIQVEVGNRWGRAVGQGQGTGFIISPDGYILTNDHVVGQAARIRVSLADGRELDGKVVGTDARTDIALIKIEDRSPLPTVAMGDSDTVEVGQWVVAIGNPFGLDHTVTAGIISAKGRRDVRPGGRRDGYYDFLQTDASINPGNSGGPLLNTRGEVIGINSAINAQGQGLGFAIPINMAKTLLPTLKEHGRVARSWLGVSIQPITRDLMKSLKLDSTEGALVAQVVPSSPAARAGLEEGDVITSFDGKKITRSDDLPWLASTAGIGKTVSMTVRRAAGKLEEIQVKLEAMPGEDKLAARGKSGAAVSVGKLGIEVTSLDERTARQLDLDRAIGAVVTRVDSGSPLSGSIVEGDVIVAVNRHKVQDAGDLTAAIAKLDSGEACRLLVIRDGVSLWLAFDMP